MTDAVIQLQGLTKRYGELTAVDHLTLSINRGEIFGLLGPNGAGKSTTILMMLGLSEPDAGVTRVCGLDSTRQPLQVKQRVGYLPDDIGFYEDRTGFENLIFTAQLNRMSYKDARVRARSLLHEVGLAHAADKKAGTYSRGMRQRLGLADVLIKSPEVVILDEPTLGIDPRGVQELLELIQRMSREQGITVLLSSHQLHQVQQICDRVGLFVSGRLIAEGDIPTLSAQLFADDPVTVNVETAQADERLSERLQSIEDVRSVSGDGRKWTLICETDCSPQIARTILEHGVELYEMQKNAYGLDEIYHRYFQGGESHERPSKQNHAD